MLSGLRVLETGVGVAAPYAGRLLALLGATVVKVEPPGGDPARIYPTDDLEEPVPTSLYLSLNADKRNAIVEVPDMPAAIGWADVILDSRTASELEGTRLTAAEVRAVNPAAILVSLTAWGYDEPSGGAIDDELLVQATSGVLTLTPDPGGLPVRLPGFQSQYLAGAYAAAAALSLVGSGPRGALIEVTWLAAMATGAEGSFSRYLQTQESPVPAGGHPPVLFPSGAFRCADGYVVPGTVRQADWEAQCLLYDMAELIDDPSYGTRDGRMANLEALWDTIQPWYDRHTRQEVVEGALEYGWAAGMVLESRDVGTDPHLQARGFTAMASSPRGDVLVPARLARDGTTLPRRARVSELGADTAWFRRQLGVSP